MRPLSASEAIGPALERTQDVLFRPFRLHTFLKIAAVACFAEFGANFNASFPGNANRGGHQLPPAVLAFVVGFAVLIGVVSLVIALVLLYVGSRLQLVLVELVATRQSYIGPMWRRVGGATWRWIGLKVLLFIGVILVSLPFTVPLVLYLIRHAHQFGSGSFFSGLQIAQIVLYIGAAIVALIVVIAIYTLVHDLAVPSLALEEVGIRESLRRLLALLNAEPGQAALYLFLRLVLGMVFGILAEIGIVIVLLISAIPPGIAGFGLWFALRNTGAAGIAVLIGLGCIAGLVYLCWAICVGVSFAGTAITFNQAYALYFLGGRYPLLGDLLDRSAPPPAFAYTPGFPPPAPLYPPPTASP